jgi:hypothetical protein
MKQRFTVIGPRRIEGVTRGGTVELDPAVHNIAALTAAGHIKPKKAQTSEEAS